MTKQRKLAAGALALTGALVLSSCGGGGLNGDGEGGEGTAPLLRIGSLQEPTNWDPAHVNQGHLPPVYQAAYDTLIKAEPDGELVPMLAESWEFSEDGLSFTMELREDVTFTDGEPFNAEAVKANIEHFQEANGPMGTNLDAVESVETPDEFTVVLQLSEPDPSLDVVLSEAGGFMGSPAALGTEEITTMPVGTGPYVLDETTTVTGSQITFERNEDYWGEELPFDSIEFHIMNDETARLNALQSDQVDAAVFNRTSSAMEVQAAGFNYEPFTVNWQGVLLFDRDGEMIPELEDVRVREALALAVDAEAINEAVEQGTGELTSQTFSPESTGFVEELEDAYEYDPERAEELLAEADAEGMTLTLPISGTFDPAIYDSLQQNWEDIGVNVERHQWGPDEAVSSMMSGEVPLAYMQLVSRDSWRHINFLAASDAPWNPLGTQRDEIDELVEQAQYGDEDEQAAAAQEINEYLVEEVWFIPVLRPENHFYWNDSVDVQNQHMNGVPSIYNYTPTGE